MRDSAEQKWLKFLLKILLPDGGYVAVFTRSSDDLVAYFDESMGEGRLPMTSVAGYLFEPEAYQEFDSGMRTLLRDHQLPYFRMQDCIHLTGPFKRWRNLNPKSPIPEIVEREVIRLTRKYAILGVGVAMSDAKYVLLQPASMEVLMGGTYRTLCQWCLAEIGDWADRNRFHGKIAYFFEAGCTSQKDANEALNKIAVHPHFSRQYRYGSHTFAPKISMIGLQAADMFAWFARREGEDAEKILSGMPARSRRKDFQALIGNTPQELKQIEHRHKYFDTESLKTFLSDDQNCPPELRWYAFTPSQRLRQT